MEKLTDADLKWLAKFVPDADLRITDKTDTRSSYYGETVTVTPAVGKIYDFVIRIYDVLNSSILLAKIHPELKPTNSVSNFDRGKYIVLKLDHDAYMKLID